MRWNGFGNPVLVAVGWTLNGAVYYPWRVCERITGRSLGCAERSHHAVLAMLQRLRRRWPVKVSWPNMLAPERRLTMRLDLCQSTQLGYFRAAGRYNERWMRILAAAMPFVECFVDVGAHYGLYAFTIIQAFPGKRVLAIEPDPDHIAALRAHQRLNELPQVEVHPVAAAAAQAEAILHRNPLNDGGAGLAPVEEFISGPWRVTAREFLRAHPAFQATKRVVCRRLDQLVNVPCVMKIDVEGNELDVLRSAEELCVRGLVGGVVLEVSESHFDEVVSWLNQHEIDVYRDDTDQPLAAGDRLGRRLANVVAIRRTFEGRERMMAAMRAGR